MSNFTSANDELENDELDVRRIDLSASIEVLEKQLTKVFSIVSSILGTTTNLEAALQNSMVCAMEAQSEISVKQNNRSLCISA